MSSSLRCSHGGGYSLPERVIDGGNRSEEDDREDQLLERFSCVEPSEVRFTAELEKHLTCPLRLLNNLGLYNMAFKVTPTDPNKYTVRPNIGVILPQSSCDIIVTMQAQREFPEDMQCMDTFVIQIVITFSGVFDLNMFNEDSRYVIPERKLRVVYVSPSEEGSSPSSPVSDDGNSNTSYLTSIPKENEEPEKQYSEIPKEDDGGKKPVEDDGWDQFLEKFLCVEPSEVRFTAELGKHLICPLRLLNKSRFYIAFKVTPTDPNKYSVRPNHGVLLSRSSCDIIVTMQAQREFPKDMQCMDKFLIQIVFSTSEVPDLNMFNEDSGYVIHERKLRVVYVSPLQFPPPIVEGSEEGSSPSTPVSDDGNSNTSDLTSIPKENEEPEKQYSEVPKEDEELEKQYSKVKKNPNHQQNKAKSESIENLLRELATDKPRQFSHEDLISYTSNLSTEIGSGAFGNVYKGQFLNGVEIAVKVIVENDVVEEEFMAEVGTMGRTYHRNLVKLYGFCFDDDMKALVYEYTSNGSLDHVLYENRFDLKWEKLYDIAVESAKALTYLHDSCYHKIIHHDIKPANVLLDLNFSPKITDFGLAKLMSRNLSHLTWTKNRGTVGYAAPETWMPLSEITDKCDVYSFGMMLLEILGRRRNVTKEAWFPKQVWKKFENGWLDEIIVNCGITEENKEKAKILCMVAFWCIQFTPETRPSMNIVSVMLEKKIQVTRPLNPFLPLLSVSSMQPSQSSQEIIYSDVSSSISSIDENIN